MDGVYDQVYSSDSSKRKRSEADTTPKDEKLSDSQKKASDDNPEPSKKKKKEFLGKTNIVTDDEYEDILESGWFYIDSVGNPQGPFSSKEMKEWYVAGFFYETTMVKQIHDNDYVTISENEAFKNFDLSSTADNTLAYYNNVQANHDSYQESDTTNYYSSDTHPYGPYSYGNNNINNDQANENADYAQTAFFNTHNGRFTPTGSSYAAKGRPEDREGRMLSHYLNMDEYQEKMRAAQNEPYSRQVSKKPKMTRKMIESIKKKNEEKKVKKILFM